MNLMADSGVVVYGRKEKGRMMYYYIISKNNDNNKKLPQFYFKNTQIQIEYWINTNVSLMVLRKYY